MQISKNLRSGIEVLFPDDWHIKSPQCAHGPMLLFERLDSCNLAKKKYYACSACRDRNYCHAFLWESDFQKRQRRIGGDEVLYIGEQRANKHKDTPKSNFTLKMLLDIPTSERVFCENCQMIVSWEHHQVQTHSCYRHKKIVGISRKSLLHPSKNLLLPKTEDKTNAQYLMSEKCSDFMVKTMQTLSFTDVICIGMPTLHEKLQYAIDATSREKSRRPDNHPINSILLDIDDRFKQFSSQESFCHFNMFNCHFFGDSDQQFQSFVRKGKTRDPKNVKFCIVIDPPFGGLIDAVVATLEHLSDLTCKVLGVESRRLLPTFWIFPYFMEKRIIEKLLGFQMLDYEVEYENHKKFKRVPNTLKSSPVRIFTNLNLSQVVLPKDEGYRFCAVCDRWVSILNEHCDICGECPSKNGKTYVHCSKCNKCVKPGWNHCDSCGRCDLKGHSCGKYNWLGCFMCGKLDHKRRNCPLKYKRKRKWSSHESNLEVIPNGNVHGIEVCTIPKPLKICRQNSFRKFTAFHRRSSHTKRRYLYDNVRFK